MSTLKKVLPPNIHLVIGRVERESLFFSPLFGAQTFSITKVFVRKVIKFAKKGLLRRNLISGKNSLDVGGGLSLKNGKISSG